VNVKTDGRLRSVGWLVAGNMIAVRVGPDLRMAVVGSPDYFARHPRVLRAAYTFRIVKNLSAYALYVHGSQPDARNQYAQDEYDLNLQWKASNGKAQGLALRARYAYVTQASPGEPITHQIRLILDYTPPRL
jgi:hypothetical protein